MTATHGDECTVGYITALCAASTLSGMKLTSHFYTQPGRQCIIKAYYRKAHPESGKKMSEIKGSDAIGFFHFELCQNGISGTKTGRIHGERHVFSGVVSFYLLLSVKVDILCACVILEGLLVFIPFCL